MAPGAIVKELSAHCRQGSKMKIKPQNVFIISLFVLFLNTLIANASEEIITAKLGEPFKLKSGQSAKIIDTDHDIVLKLLSFQFIPSGFAYGLDVNFELIIDGIVHKKGSRETWFPGVPYDFFIRYHNDKTYIEFAVLDSIQVCMQPEGDVLRDDVKEYIAYLSRDKNACYIRLAKRLFNFNYCERLQGSYITGSPAGDGCIINVIDQIRNSEQCNKVNSALLDKCGQALTTLTFATCSKIINSEFKSMCFKKVSEIKNEDITSCDGLKEVSDKEMCKKALISK